MIKLLAIKVHHNGIIRSILLVSDSSYVVVTVLQLLGLIQPSFIVLSLIHGAVGFCNVLSFAMIIVGWYKAAGSALVVDMV